MGSPIQPSSALSSEASIPSFLRLSAGEDDLLARSASRLATPERAQRFAETFYAWLRHVPETEPILHHVDAAAWARLRAGQSRHYRELLTVPYDRERRRVLRHLGAMHQRMGLPSEWLNGAYALYLEDLQAGANALPDLSAEDHQVLRKAIRKRVELDRFWQMEGFQEATLELLDIQKRFYHALAEIGDITRAEAGEGPSSMLQAIADRLARILDLSLVWIGCLSPGDPWVRVMAAAGPAKAYADGLRVSSDPALPEGQGPVGQAIRAGKAQVTADISQAWNEPQFAVWRGQAERFGLGGNMTAAARRGDGGMVTLSLYRGTGSSFPDGLASLLTSLVQELATFLDHQSVTTRLLRLQGYQEAQRHLQQELLAQPDPAHIYQSLAQNLVRFAETEGVDVLLASPDSPVLERALVVGPLAEAIRTLPTPYKQAADSPERPLPDKAWSTRSAQIRLHPAEDQALPDAWREGPLAGVSAVGAWPLLLNPEEEPVAVLVIFARAPDTFSTELTHLIEEMVQSAAMALRQYADRQALARLTTLYHALTAEGDLLLRAGDERRLLRDTCHRLVESGLFTAAWIGQPDDDGRFFRYLAASGPGAQALQQLQIPVADSGGVAQPLVTRAWHSGRIHYNQDHLADPELSPWRDFLLRYRWRSAAAVPVRRNGARWAILAVIADEIGIFQQPVLELFSRIALILGHGLDELDLRRSLREERDRQQYLALHDPLTDIPNRAYFLQTGQEALSRARREQKQLAIGILDLDGFKEVNDVLGHSVGDRLLQSIAGRLQGIRRGGDVVTRLGGDEFGFHFPVTDAGDLALISQRILTAVVSAAATVADMPISGSIGWAVFPGDGEDFDLLFAHADEAMYAAKAAGKSTFRLYGGPVSQSAQRRIWVHQHFPRAIAGEQVRFFLQPQADVLAGRLEGVEMLVRWRRKDGRWNAPGKFMSVVEEDVHLIRGLGIWGLQEAARLRQRFAQLGLDLGISLNIGARHFLHPAFLDDLEEHCPQGNGITLEITETVALADLKTSAAIAAALKDRGFRLSMDDFGTGYSSLLYAAKLPFDELKLDQDFVRNFRHDHASFAVAGAARLLGDLSGRSLIAEGIATPADLALWMRMGGTRIQGYHLSPPLAENAFLTWHSWLLPLLRTAPAICPLEDLALLIHITEDPESLGELFRHTAASCPLGIWFAQKQGKYGKLPGFAEAKAIHERLHRLTPNNSSKERADLQRRMREITTQLYREVAAWNGQR